MQRRDIIKLAVSGAATAQVLNIAWKGYTFAAKKSIASQVTIDWATQVATTTPFTFGSNDYEITNPKLAADRVYQRRLQELGIKLIRIHHAGLSDRWTNSTTKTWNVGKIQQGYEASYPQQPTIIQNIPSWPQWMPHTNNGLLDESEYDNYAVLCAQLVEILNRRLQKKVIYWEPLNEKEVSYQKAGKLDELWIIYNKIAKAMKGVDPQIKVGGPALTWDNPRKLAAFLSACKPNVDFISWHRYGSGNAKETTQSLMSHTPNYASQVREFRAIATKQIPERYVPLLLGEYNINYSWQSGENRQNTYIGAVWFASVLKHLAEAGIDMATSWHLKDGIYGMIDPKNNLRPAATVFAWGNKYLIGKVMEAHSDYRFVEALAVQKQDGQRNLLLINKSDELTDVRLQLKSFTPKPKNFNLLSLDASGVKSRTSIAAEVLQRSLTLKPYSLTLVQVH